MDLFDSSKKDMDWDLISYQLIKEYRNIRWYYKLEQVMPKHYFDAPAIIIEMFKGGQRLGFYRHADRTIGISKKMVSSQPWYVVQEVFKHEVAHLIAADDPNRFPDETAHGPAFQRAADKVGLSEWGRKATSSIKTFVAQNTMSEADHRVVDRLEKLVALSRSPNPHEAALAMERLEAMQNKYNIDAAQKKRLNIANRVFSFGKKRRPSWATALVSLLMHAYDLNGIYTSHYDSRKRCWCVAIDFFGTHESLELAEYTWNFLVSAAHRSYRQYSGTKGVRAYNSFIRSFMRGCRETLESRQKAEAQTVSVQQNALVLVETKELIGIENKKALHHKYRRISRSAYASYSTDSNASEAGYEEGRSATLNPGMKSGVETLMITA